MLTDNELRELRNRKKREDAFTTSAGKNALNTARKRNEQEIAKMLKPWTEGAKPPEFPIKENHDPVRKALKAGGYID